VSPGNDGDGGPLAQPVASFTRYPDAISSAGACRARPDALNACLGD